MRPENRERSEHRPSKEARDGLRDAFRSLQSIDPPLPVLQQRDEIGEIIRSGDRIVIEADTGSGKSTIMPLLLLEDALTRNRNARVLVTQPRRVAAENLASYLGEKMGGNLVDFRHGSKKEVHDETQLEFTMEGSLLRDLVTDPTLDKYDAVLLDEVHERSINLDTLLPLLKIAQEKRRQMGRPLKVVLTSATLDREKVLAYFDGAKHKSVEGRMFPVKEFYENRDYKLDEVMKKAADVASDILQKGEEPGDMLIFMPGKAEIEKTIRELKRKENITDDEIEIIPLIGGEDSAETAKRIRSASTKRRIFVATNVAETSITIPSVRIVIDSGYMRMDVFDPDTGITSLEDLRHTKSNAKQRKGRAGRTAEGTYHALFSEAGLAERKDHLEPEILRTNLVAQILLMKSMGIHDFENFDFLDHPGTEKIQHAIDTLKQLEALNDDGSLTEVGAEMAKIGTEPHFARMLVEARALNCEDDVALVISLLSRTRSIFDDRFKPETPFAEKYADYYSPNSDIITTLKVWNDYIRQPFTDKNDKESKEQRDEWASEKGIKTFQLFTAANARKDLLYEKEIEDEPVSLTEENIARITQSVLCGLLDNIVIKRNTGYQTRAGTSVRINKDSSLSGQEPEIFASGSIRRFGKKATTPIASYNIALDRETLRQFAPQLELDPVEVPIEAEATISEPQPEIAEAIAEAVAETHPTTNVANPLPYNETSQEVNLHVPEVSHHADTTTHEQKNIFAKIADKVKYFVNNLLRKLGFKS